MPEFDTQQAIRTEALRFATDGVGKTRFNPDLVIATAVKYAAYITDGTIPVPEIIGIPATGGPMSAPIRRGRPRKTTGEGG